MKTPISDRRATFVQTVVVGLLALAAGWVGPAYAGSNERKGTAGAQELLMGVGPRGTALGSAVTADASGVEAMFWNPAGLGTVKGTEAMFSHTGYFADQKLNYAAVASHVGGAGVLAFDAKVLSIGDIIVTTEDAPEGTGQILNPTFTVLGLGYARQFTDRVLFGGVVHYVNEQIANASASGLAFDFGVQYTTGWNGLQFGIAMKNFGSQLEFSGADFDVNLLPPGSDPQASNRPFALSSAPFEMPSYFALGGTVEVYAQNQQRLALLSGFQSNNFEFDYLLSGLEWSYRHDYALRASYFGSFGSASSGSSLSGSEGSLEFNSGNDLYSGFALGGGAQIHTGGDSRLGVDVSWRPVRSFFDDVVEFGIHYSF